MLTSDDRSRKLSFTVEGPGAPREMWVRRTRQRLGSDPEGTGSISIELADSNEFETHDGVIILTGPSYAENARDLAALLIEAADNACELK